MNIFQTSNLLQRANDYDVARGHILHPFTILHFNVARRCGIISQSDML